jgi:hypothetical protein
MKNFNLLEIMGQQKERNKLQPHNPNCIEQPPSFQLNHTIQSLPHKIHTAKYENHQWVFPFLLSPNVQFEAQNGVYHISHRTIHKRHDKGYPIPFETFQD